MDVTYNRKINDINYCVDILKAEGEKTIDIIRSSIHLNKGKLKFKRDRDFNFLCYDTDVLGSEIFAHCFVIPLMMLMLGLAIPSIWLFIICFSTGIFISNIIIYDNYNFNRKPKKDKVIHKSLVIFCSFLISLALFLRVSDSIITFAENKGDLPKHAIQMKNILDAIPDCVYKWKFNN